VNVGRFTLERLRLPGVTTLPVWNRPLPDGRELWERVGAPRVGEQRRLGVSEREIGRGMAAALLPVLAGLQEQLRPSVFFLTGGLCAISGFREELVGTRAACPVTIAREPAWAAAEAGLAWLAEQGAPGGAVVDVGQTSIKTLTSSARILHERDLSVLPLRLIAPDGTSHGAPTVPVAAFLAGGLRAALASEAPKPRRVLLALPCPLEDDLVPGPCTYGWQGDRELLPAVFGLVAAAPRADVARPIPDAGVSVLVLNDAELGAEAARRALAPEPGTRVLCLTLGFGPGGALLEA